MKITLFLFTFLFFSQSHALPDAATDEATCKAHHGHLQAEIANAQVLEMITAMKSVLMDAYAEMKIEITEDKITFFSPTTSVTPRQDGEEGDEMVTMLVANVNAGKDSIQAMGTSSMYIDRTTERTSTVDKIGRVTATKLVCAVTASYYETAVRNTSGGEIGGYSDSKDLAASLELP